MGHNKMLRVQHHPISRQCRKTRIRLPTIDVITNDDMPKMFQMHTNLMGSPGVDRASKQGRLFAKRLDAFPVRVRIPSSLTLLPDRHLVTVLGIAADRLGDAPAQQRRHSLNQRQVFLVQRSF